MAVAPVNANIARQKAYNTVYGTGTTASPVSPYDFYAVKSFFLHMALNKGNPDLQFVPVDGIFSSSDGGANASQVLVNGPCTLYAVFLKKVGTVETIFKGSNNASTAGTDGTQDLAFALTAAGTIFAAYPDGRALSTGLTVTENTTRTGSTLTLKANKLDGFVIVSA
jgi:hypothetical protein